MSATNLELDPQEIIQDYERFKLSHSGAKGMASSNWPTVLAHRCTAYAVFNRIVPADQRRSIAASLAMIFEEGKDQHLRVKRDLLDMGYEVLGDEAPLQWREYNISGKKDFAVRRNGSEAVDVDVKSCNQWTFEALNTVEDVRQHKSDWIRAWDRQLSMYMVLKGRSKYFMLLKNKTTGAWKIIVYTLGAAELEIAEQMIKRAEFVNELVQIGVDVESVPTDSKLADPDVCAECQFLTVCNPPLVFGPGARILNEAEAAEMAEMADRRAELAANAKAYAELDEELKDRVKRAAGEEAKQVVFGDWVASVNRQKNGTRINFIKTGAKS